MSPEKIQQAVQFFSTSAVLNEMSSYQGAHSSPLAGYRFGLGMAKVYTEYFGGFLEVGSQENKGTEVRIGINCKPKLAVENI